MWKTLPLLFLLIISSRLNFGSAQVKVPNNDLPDGLSGSRDFSYEGRIEDGSVRKIEKSTTTTTTVPPEFRQCVDSCLATATIRDNRPVCGTDRVTYNNHEHFTCAVQCGRVGINKLYTDKCSEQF